MRTYADKATPLIAIDENKRLHVMLSSDEMIPKAGWKLISLVEAEALPKEEVAVAAAASEEK